MDLNYQCYDNKIFFQRNSFMTVIYITTIHANIGKFWTPREAHYKHNRFSKKLYKREIWNQSIIFDSRKWALP